MTQCSIRDCTIKTNYINYSLEQRCTNYGPRVKPGPTDNFIRPADVFDFSSSKIEKKMKKLKEYNNLRRHYDTKDASTYSQFKDKQRSEKFESMHHRSLCSQQNLFKKANSENEALTLVTIKVAYLLAQKKNTLYG